MQLRSRVLIGLLLTSALPAAAVEKITVAQLEQIIAANVVSQHAAVQNPQSPDEIAQIPDSDLLADDDGRVVSRLADIELKERLSTLSLYQLAGKYKLGVRAQMVLQQIADRSALLNLPPSEQIARSAPDNETQRAMFNAARDFVFGELSHLPDFVATRTTTTFDDVQGPLRLLLPGADTEVFHRRGVVEKEITFRDGKEVLQATSSETLRKTDDTEAEFESRGEFGSQAAVLLMDVQGGSVFFDHWEDTLGGIAAVYKYTVPRAGSHYEVTDRCEGQASFHDMPGYHGSIALAPQTGAILRITLEADSNKGDPVSHVASIVEYGPVLIGNRRYLCPLRSLAFMVEEATDCSQHRRRLQKPITIFNRTIFSNYHRFGSSSTIIYDQVKGGEPSREVVPRPLGRQPQSPSPQKTETGVQPRLP